MLFDFLFTFFGFRHRITSFLFNQGCRRFLNSGQDTSAKFSLSVGKRDCMVFRQAPLSIDYLLFFIPRSIHRFRGLRLCRAPSKTLPFLLAPFLAWREV